LIISDTLVYAGERTTVELGAI